MKKTFTIIIKAFIFIQLFASCEKLKIGVCETKDTFSDGRIEYSCTSVYDSENDCIGSNYSFTTSVWHENSSCNDLGYTKGESGIGSYTFISPSGKNYPGDYGYFSGESGGSVSSYCTESYQNPGVGVQLSSYCEGAYTYLCIGGYSSDSEEVSSYCNLYNAMNAQDGNKFPACPYCK